MSLHGRFPASPPVSLSPASSSSPSSHSPSSPDLKQRVIACLNKLADRDTLALAAAELDSIARNLTHDSFSSFLSCIHTTDSSSKSPVRKHSVAVLSLMSRHHGESLSPHLSKMVSTIIRRLRDPDSSVRSACAAATADISAHVTRQPFASVAKPLIETLIQEGDSNVQTGAAVCLAASVEAAADPEPEQLRKSLPKIGKMLKSEAFKAKAALLSAVGSIITAGGAGSKPVLDWLVPVLIDFLSSEDWAARKSAAEGLSRVAAAEEELAWEYKKACTAALESRRFDKVKSVRETMNRALSQWKEVANDVDEALLSPCTSSLDVGVKSSRLKKSTRMIKRSPSLPVNRSYVASRQQKENLPRRNVTVSVASREEEQVKSGGPDIIKHTISEKGREDKKVGGFDCGLRSGSRVAPCSDDGDDSCDSLVKNGKDGVDESRKDSEELSLIREQLAMIENQQSSLLDLLRKFMGSSQSGIQSLESRVSGLEMALDEISCDLAVSNGRVPKTSSCGGESCSKLPGAEFLSHKYWRKAEERPMQTRSTASETAAHENSFDQGMQKRGSVFQKRSARNQFQDSVHTTLQKPTTRGRE
ncbi:TORTIFOLIA1-like protein 4 [Brassica napus]|nr:TORTIFOLIA1-like protein 4 [Brassica napus]XP_048621842.1 TORTIFOLIA1-like protein 4 [Brassica napus]XP_048621843.1 TORTIFOLIA1-like protein 4 [Brassica napus]XP_048621844.1 TORTIFOLIA1-like protein 4 [Brassica napus]XP_048621845.1 TORTIFOLIA1-like protein 4 [Brassica napus]XP_048621846.1 TORTIFOLIA1-like protein 4 [Brassica napus]